jgi:hypothetical protein
MKRYCRFCGKITESDIEIKYCAHCGAEFESIGEPSSQEPQGEGLPRVQPMAPKTSAGEGETKYCAWEDKARLGFVGALFETWKASLFNPTVFFRRMPVTGGIANPLIYGIILGMIGVIFSMMYQQFWGNLLDMSRFAPYMGPDFDWEAYNFSRQIQSIWYLVGLILSPVFITVGFFIVSGILHLILMIFGWNKETFEASFRIIAYSEGAYFFEIVPFLGGAIAFVWATVLYIIGIKEVHRLTVGQSLLVVFLPLILFCLCCCGFFTWIVGMAGISN